MERLLETIRGWTGSCPESASSEDVLWVSEYMSKVELGSNTPFLRLTGHLRTERDHCVLLPVPRPETWMFLWT